MTAAGLVIGIAGTIALTPLLQSLLFHVSPRDPVMLATVALVTTAISLVASYLPARHAIAIEAMKALRAE